MRKASAILLILFAGLLAACTPGRTQEAPANPADTAPLENGAGPGLPAAQPRSYEDLEIVTLLPRDAIPAIDNPQFLSLPEADEEYDPQELVIGVAHSGEARAYSIGLLSSHEIVNDTIGGAKIAVTW